MATVIVWQMLTMLLVLGLCPVATAQTGERGWRETFQVDAPLLAAKRFEVARGLIETAEWDAALAALVDLEEEFPDTLVRVSQGRYLTVATAAKLLRLQLSTEGLVAYRQQIDGWAEQQFASAVAAHDDAALHGLLQTAFASSAGDDALDTLAEWAWERGDLPTARRLWTQLIAIDTSPPSLLLRYPDSSRDPAAIHTRLILCSLAEGDLERAEDELLVFEELFPEATGTIAGQDGRLVEVLQSLIQRENDWPTTHQPPSWSTFAQNPARNAVVRENLTLGRPLWTLPLKPVYVPRWERPRQALPERGLLARHLVTYESGVFFHDGVRIYGLSGENGQPLWPINSDAPDNETPGKVYPPFPSIPNSLPWMPIVGIPRFTSTVDGGRLFALLGPSVLTLPPGGHQASPTRLVCINLAEGQGRIEWFHIPEELFEPGWLVTGSPVVHGEFCYVPLLRSDPQMEVAVACLRSQDCSLVWQQTVGQILREPLGGRVELGHQLLTLADDRLFLATDFGAVAALDAASGEVEWVVTYPAQESTAVDRSDEASRGLMPPIAYEGVVLVKPNDGNKLLAIDADTGLVFWRRPVPGPIVHLLGVAEGTLFASGDQLWAIDIGTGRLRWRFGYDDVAGYGYGRGVILGDQIVWPTREELFLVDASSGSLRKRVRLDDSLGVSGGNIIVAGDRLLIAGPDHLTAYALDDASKAE